MPKRSRETERESSLEDAAPLSHSLKKYRAAAPASGRSNHSSASGTKIRHPRVHLGSDQAENPEGDTHRILKEKSKPPAPSSSRSVRSTASSSRGQHHQDDNDDADHHPHKRRRTGPTTQQSEDDQCLHLALYAVRSGGLFLDFDSCLQIGVYRALEDLEDTALRRLTTTASNDYDGMKDHEVIFCDRLWQWIEDHCPYLQDLIRSPSKFKELRGRIGKITEKMGVHRGNDIKNCKQHIGSIAAVNSSAGLDPPITHLSQRAELGFSHKDLARLLVPVAHFKTFMEDEETVRLQIKNGNAPFVVRSSLLPSFMYRGKHLCGDQFDPDRPWKGLCDGFLLARFLKMLFINPKASLAANASTFVKPRSNCLLMESPKVTREHVAYAMIILRFVMCSASQWPMNDGDYSFKRAHSYFVAWLNDERVQTHVDAILARINKFVYGHEEGYKPGRWNDDSDASGDEENDFDRLLRLPPSPASSDSLTYGRTPRLKTVDLEVELDGDTELVSTSPEPTFDEALDGSAPSSRPPSTASKPPSASARGKAKKTVFTSDEDEDEPAIASNVRPADKDESSSVSEPRTLPPALVSSSSILRGAVNVADKPQPTQRTKNIPASSGSKAPASAIESDLSSIEEDPAPAPKPATRTRAKSARISTGGKPPAKRTGN
ncbi:hypothetical protein CONPUDRAFT_159164 [Coniophora puteana RWD-64-598 SS2]|uniref:Uncharacterized protein n=1 Tax=Coniophora puteana (strain RWD-64-598) TaxID=741705 RepID=A0A5M3MAR8_CONPW|nr:uncharacterized protein CONPUDRAFT_159164 [Coniophora puteana RWD-64-598 SS2]EIW75731.1 hypothetical protein CONPUDRAFT_159164 [Coniophora puteana RWD-64-598 SS2]